MSDATTPEGSGLHAAPQSGGPVRDELGRFVYDTTYDPADGDKYDDDSHLQGLDDEGQ